MKLTLFFALVLSSLTASADWGYEAIGLVFCKAESVCKPSEFSHFDNLAIAEGKKMPEPFRTQYCDSIDQSLNTSDKLREILEVIVVEKQLDTCIYQKI